MPHQFSPLWDDVSFLDEARDSLKSLTALYRADPEHDDLGGLNTRLALFEERLATSKTELAKTKWVKQRYVFMYSLTALAVETRAVVSLSGCALQARLCRPDTYPGAAFSRLRLNLFSLTEGLCLSLDETSATIRHAIDQLARPGDKRPLPRG